MTAKDWALLLIPTSISVASFIISYLSYSKDASKIRLNTDYSIALDEPPSLSVEVSNIGKRPTTITEAGFRPNHQTTLIIPALNGKETSVSAVADIKVVNDYTTIPPGEVKRFHILLDEWPSPFIHADTELITYAKDITGKYHYGTKAAYLRMIINGLGKSQFKINNIPPNALDSKQFKQVPLTRKLLYPHKFSLAAFFIKMLKG